MALSYLEIYDKLAVDANLLHRTTVALVKAAVDVFAEDPGTDNHVNRMDLANAIANSPEQYALRFVFVVGSATDTVEKALQDDGALLQFVKSGWDLIAGSK